MLGGAMTQFYNYLKAALVTTDRFGLFDLRSAVLKSIGWLKHLRKTIKVYEVILNLAVMMLLMCFWGSE